MMANIVPDPVVDDSIKDVLILVKWCGKEYTIGDLNELDTVAGLRHEIFKQTQVRPERQKLLNLKFKGYILRTNKSRQVKQKLYVFQAQMLPTT